MKPVPTPFALQDAPALIETVFPAQKVSLFSEVRAKPAEGAISAISASSSVTADVEAGWVLFMNISCRNHSNSRAKPP